MERSCSLCVTSKAQAKFQSSVNKHDCIPWKGNCQASKKEAAKQWRGGASNCNRVVPPPLLPDKQGRPQTLSGPVRDTPPYRAIPFRDSIAEGGIAPICLVFIGYRASIAEIPPLRGGYRTSTSHALQGGNAQKKGRGYRTQLAMWRHQKPHSAQ